MPKLDADGRAALRALVEAAPDGTLDEWATTLAEQTGVHLHGSTVWRYVRRADLTRKKRHPGLPSNTVTT